MIPQRVSAIVDVALRHPDSMLLWRHTLKNFLIDADSSARLPSRGVSTLSMIQDRVLEWFPRVVPWKLLAPLTLPVGRQLKTKWHFWYESARMIETAFGFAFNNRVIGDYLEFGVYQGRTFSDAWEAARRYGLSDMRFHAFDSFQGLPDPGLEDEGGGFSGGQFRCERAKFESSLRRRKVDMSRVGIHQGMFNETLTERTSLQRLGIRQASIVWIDCDLYASTVPVLRALTDVLVDGTILVFDDWFCFNGRPDRGEQRACAEWLEANPRIRLVEYQKFHWAGASFIVNID